MRNAFASVVCMLFTSAASAQPPAWVSIKGQVVLPEQEPIPVIRPLGPIRIDANHCLANGPLPDEKLLVNPKNRGIKNVVVWLRPAGMDPKAKFDPKDIHPLDAKRKPETVTITQPCCLFIPRVLAARVGDTIEVKNPAPVNHNFFWTSAANGEININIPPGGKHVFGNPLVPESSPIAYRCTIHPWMIGYVRVFDHPYFAITDADGRFEIKNAPAGNWSLVYWHESVGFKGGKAGRFGDALAIPPNDKTMEMKPTDFLVK